MSLPGRTRGPDGAAFVFERFRRSRDADPHEPGLGLGLWITRALATAQDGSIDLTSAGPGRGTTVTVRLPPAAAQLSPS
jgi:signal transduction histidine kinase